MRRSQVEENNYLRLYMKDADKKAGEKMGELENAMAMLSRKIDAVRDALQEDSTIKLSYLEKKIANLPTPNELTEAVQTQLAAVRAEVEAVAARQQGTADRLEGELARSLKREETWAEKQREEVHNDSEQCISMRSSFREEGKPKRKHKRNRLEAAQQEELGQLMGRLEETEGSLQPQRRSILSNSRIVRTNENITNVHPKSNFTRKLDPKLRELETLITAKLTHIEELAAGRVSQVEKELVRLANRNEIVDEHIGILSRKLEKEKFRVVEISENIKKYDDKKVDEKVIESLRNLIKKISKDMEEALEQRLTREVYEKDRQKVMEKLQFATEMILEKAEKAEVRKGLAFLEEKIKEVIIVLTEERNGSQDGAAKRLPFKCLSCDKDLEGSPPEPPLKPRESSCTILRNTTNQMRKRIRMINNTVSTLNLNED